MTNPRFGRSKSNFLLDASLFALDTSGDHYDHDEHHFVQGNNENEDADIEDGIKNILRILSKAEDTIQHVVSPAPSSILQTAVPEPTPLGPEGVASRVVQDVPLTDAQWIINDDNYYMSNLLESFLLPQSNIFNRETQLDHHHEDNYAAIMSSLDYSPPFHHQMELEGNNFKKRRRLSMDQSDHQMVVGKLHRSVLSPYKNLTSTTSFMLSPSCCSSSAASEAAAGEEGCTTTTTTQQHGSSSSSSSESSNTNDRFRNYQAGQWNERFEDLKVYQAKNGHCLVPHNFPENQALSQWVKRQRYQFKLKLEGKHSTLTDERQTKLEAMGFIWDSHKAAWEEKFRELCLFRQKYGHSNVPAKYTNKALAIWVKCQRRQYKLHRQGAQSAMNAERIQKLESLGFVFNPRNL